MQEKILAKFPIVVIFPFSFVANFYIGFLSIFAIAEFWCILAAVFNMSYFSFAVFVKFFTKFFFDNF